MAQRKPFTKVEELKDGSLKYTDADGRTVIRQDLPKGSANPGVLPWKNNNPGNLRCSKVTAALRALGCHRGFAVFPDVETGRRAMAVAIESKRGHRPDGKKRTIRDMISLYAPSSENDVDAYINAIKRSHGFSGDEDLEVILKDKEKYRQLREAMERKEGYWVPDLGTGVGQKVPDEREKLVKQGWENGAPPPREAYVPPKPREVTGDLPPRTPTVVPKPEPPRTTPSQPPPRRRTEREGDDLIGLAGFANEDDWSVVATHGIHDADARVKGDLARILYYADAPASPDDRKTGEADGLNMYIAGPGRTLAYGWKYDQRGRRRAGGEGEVEVKAHIREGHPVAAHTRSRPDRA